ncbi:MAG TPA: CmcI family methyltransferase [Candidatus Limnocylindrales bacterium]|nr:CmcI family methyltransferase [Candidatus Limnocylindrales bacterium]
MRRFLGRLRRSTTRRVRAFVRPPAPLRVGSYRPPTPNRPPTPAETAATESFHRAYYEAWLDGQGSMDLAWLGHRTMKSPMDLWAYQEIVAETKPEVVVESGTAFGGSSYYLASLFDLLGRGEVITIDIEARPGQPSHPRITRIVGSSTDPAVVDDVRRRVAGRRAMVILDSDHSERHVAAELAAYRSLVAPGCYLIVEDTNVNGHPVVADHGPGPMEAVAAFLPTAPEYEVDTSRERFMLTLNPGGYLRRVR